MRTMYLTLCCVFSLLAAAQKTVDVNNTAGVGVYQYYTVGGVPFVNTKYVNLIDGSPYLTDHWLKGYIVSTGGQRFGGSLLKLDLMNNELHYLNNAGQEMLSTVDAKEMLLEDTIQQVKYHLVRTSDLPTGADRFHWMQLITGGKVRLLKASLKLLSETLPYGASTHEQRIHTKYRFYLDEGSSVHAVKTEKELTILLSDKRAELDAFQKMLDKKLSSEERLTAMVRYYNSLHKKP